MCGSARHDLHVMLEDLTGDTHVVCIDTRRPYSELGVDDHTWGRIEMQIFQSRAWTICGYVVGIVMGIAPHIPTEQRQALGEHGMLRRRRAFGTQRGQIVSARECTTLG